MAKSSSMRRKIQVKQLARSDLEGIFQADVILFPGRLTLNTLESWYDKNTTNFLSYYIYDESKSDRLSEENLGTFIAFPMKPEPWKKVISGDLEEHDITSEMILQQSCLSCSSIDLEQGYGMHIWHIEKSKLWNQFCSTSFKEVFWTDLQRSVSFSSLKKMNCIGFSALCASPEGTRAISKLGFHCVGHFNFIVQNKQGECKVVHSTEWDQKSSKDKEESEMIFKCGMYVTCSSVQEIDMGIPTIKEQIPKI